MNSYGNLFYMIYNAFSLQYGYPHNSPGTQIIIENGFFRGWSQQKIKAEEQHQR